MQYQTDIVNICLKYLLRSSIITIVIHELLWDNLTMLLQFSMLIGHNYSILLNK